MIIRVSFALFLFIFPSIVSIASVAGADGRSSELKEIRESIKSIDKKLDAIRTSFTKMEDQAPMSMFEILLLLLTLFYVLGTFLLWKTTKRQVKVATETVNLTRESLEATKQAVYGSTLQGIAINHREIAFKALGCNLLMRTFMPASLTDQPREPLNAETRLFSTVLINHAETCFEHVRFKTIPSEFAGPLLGDIERIFALHAIQLRWKESRDGVEEEFRRFGDNALQKLEKNL